ncbi:putative reverse transcriptase domain-containing protein [Tanacetum coccineum]
MSRSTISYESLAQKAPASPVVSDSDSVEPSLNSEPFSGHDTSVGSAASDPDNEPLGSLGTTGHFGGSEFSKDDPSKHGSIDAMSVHGPRKTVRPRPPLPPSILARIEDWIVAYLSSPQLSSPRLGPSRRRPRSSPSSSLGPPPKRGRVSPAPASPAPALHSVPIELLPPRKSFTASKRIETLERERGMTTDAIEELINQHMDDALATYETNRNTKNGNGNRNGSGSRSDRGSGSRTTMHTARGCTYKEFLNCQPLNIKVKYASCTLLNGALTMWNSHVRTVVIDVAYKMSLKEMMKLMTKAYCPRNEIQKLKGEMVPEEEDKVEILDSIQGNVTFAGPVRLQDVLKLANNLIDQKQGHYKSDCPKLKNQNRGNTTGNAAGSSEGHGRVYALGGGNADQYLNVITGTFLLNSRYASILFDTGADRIFVLTAFISLIDITPYALDTKYDVELADRKIIGVDTII